MSSTLIIPFGTDGKATDREIAFRNSWRGGAAIWSYMEKEYLPPYIPEYYPEDQGISLDEFESKYGYRPSRMNSGETAAMEPLWRLAYNDDVPFHERVCLATTFDNVLVKKEDFPKLVEALRSFPADDTSLPEQADAIEGLFKDGSVSAIGWIQTTVCSNTWTHHFGNEYEDMSEEEQDWYEGRPYDYNEDDKHWFLFDEIK